VRGLRARRPAAYAGSGDLSGVVVRLIGEAPEDDAVRASRLRRLGFLLSTSARRAGAVGMASGQWLTDKLVEVAPQIPIRDAETLRAQHEGLYGDALAWALIEAAARGTGAVGAAGGLLSSVELAAPPLLLTAPVQVAAETLAVVAIELKLVAELHELYGRAAVGTPAVRTAAYLGAWTRRRALDPASGRAGLSGLISAGARKTLRRRLVRRAGENAVTLVPFRAGALAGASLNARETRRLGQKIASDLGARLG
jgi:hypothetical protein